MVVSCVIFSYCSYLAKLKIGKIKCWQLMRIKIHFEIFLAYKFQKSGNHLEKEPSA